MTRKEELLKENETLAKKIEQEHDIFKQLIEPIKFLPNQPLKIWSPEELNKLDKQWNIVHDIIKRMQEIRAELASQE